MAHPLHLERGVLAGQTKVNEIINGRTLGPGVSLRSTLEVHITIDFDRMEPIWIHFRRAKHYIVGESGCGGLRGLSDFAGCRRIRR